MSFSLDQLRQPILDGQGNSYYFKKVCDTITKTTTQLQGSNDAIV